MKNSNWIAAAVIFLIGLSALSLHAQTLPYAWSNTSSDFELRADGTLIEKGTGTAVALSGTDLGAGTRFLWYPSRSAIRAGTVTGTDWDITNLGQYSTAFGLDSTAYGVGSTSIGSGNNAGGPYGVALGVNNLVAGYAGIAIGNGSTSGYSQGSIAIGSSCAAPGYMAVAIGDLCNATTNWAVALGYGANATGPLSFALNQSTASGNTAVSTGFWTLASGDFSSSFGYQTSAVSMCSVAIGRGNIGNGSGTLWQSGDPLFEIGNGSAGAPSDAMIVYKNGNITAQGSIRCSPGGDLSMGSFVAGTHP